MHTLAKKLIENKIGRRCSWNENEKEIVVINGFFHEKVSAINISEFWLVSNKRYVNWTQFGTFYKPVFFFKFGGITKLENKKYDSKHPSLEKSRSCGTRNTSTIVAFWQRLRDF